MSDVPITSSRRHAKAESGFSPAQQAVAARPVGLGPAVFDQTETSPWPLRHSLPHPSQHPAVGLPVVQGSQVLPEPSVQPPQQRQSPPVARLQSPPAGPMPRRAAPAGAALTGIRKINNFPSPDACLKQFCPEPDVRIGLRRQPNRLLWISQKLGPVSCLQTNSTANAGRPSNQEPNQRIGLVSAGNPEHFNESNRNP